MIRQLFISVFILTFLLISTTSCRNTDGTNDYLISFNDTAREEYGYKNLQGEIIIPGGKYSMCFTDTFRTYALVLKPGDGFVAIDRNEKILYKVFPVDNGPDYPSEGLFRIIENNKIGFADSLTGKISIAPQFDCAFSFENGIAKVSNNCKKEMQGEYEMWTSENWYYIDHTGKKTTPPVSNETTEN
jgi:hypothetical protein